MRLCSVALLTRFGSVDPSLSCARKTVGMATSITAPLSAAAKQVRDREVCRSKGAKIQPRNRELLYSFKINRPLLHCSNQGMLEVFLRKTTARKAACRVKTTARFIARRARRDQSRRTLSLFI